MAGGEQGRTHKACELDVGDELKRNFISATLSLSVLFHREYVRRDINAPARLCFSQRLKGYNLVLVSFYISARR